jgi:hypothetical protein
MRPAPIPAEAIREGARRIVVAPPGGDLTDPDIAPVEAVIDRPEGLGGIRLSVRCVLEPGDLEKLTAGGHVWVSFYGQVVPFCVDVTRPNGE